MVSRWWESTMPSPVPPMVISPTTAPVTDRVKPVRSPARIAGRAMGSSMCTIMEAPWAPSSLAASRTSASRPRRPSRTVTVMGKKTMKAHRTTTGAVP